VKTAALCAGYGGLELGLHLAGFDVELSWYAEIDKGACTIMEANYPGVPNLGDLTLIEDAPAVELVTAGFPCQPVSTAGSRKGVDDERWLIHDVCKVASRVGAQWLFLENVGGLYSANGGRAFSQVVVALASYGFSAEWTCLRAADVGAPHNRLRWFCLAYAEGAGQLRASKHENHDSDQGRGRRRDVAGLGKGSCSESAAYAPSSQRRHKESEVLGPSIGPTAESGERDWAATAYADDTGLQRCGTECESREGCCTLKASGDFGATADADCVRREGPLQDRNVQSRQSFSTDKVVANANDSGRQQQRRTFSVSPEYNAAEHTGDHVGDQREPTAFASDPVRVRQQRDTASGRQHESEQPGRVASETVGARNAPVVFDGRGSRDLAARFGQYADAIARWEPIVGRVAPNPTDNERRLNPEFVEFMMGLPEGWVTGPLVNRGAALKALGNGVVPQQAAAAILLLVEQMKWEHNKEEVEL
jgi:DNA (cytosine-5)-methyltransferase 1